MHKITFMQEILLVSIPLDRFKSEISDAIKQELDKYHQTKPVEQNQQELLTRNEASLALGVSLPTLHSWTKTGIIKAYRIGSRIRYKKSDIETALLQIKTDRTSNAFFTNS